MLDSRHDVAVIGAGIVGVATAIRLVQDGHRVTLIDKLGPAEGTSYGNAGVLASCSVVPVTVPGLPFKAPGMLLNPGSPLFVRWSYLPRMLPWLWRYLRECNAPATQSVARAMTPIIGDSLDQHLALARGTPAEKWIVPSDYLFVYRDRAAYEADGFVWRLREDCGFKWDTIEGAAIREYDPAFGPAAGFIVRLGDHGHIKDPGRYVKDLATHYRSLGGTIKQAEVIDFKSGANGLEGLITSEGTVACTRAVLSAGVWSGPLAARLGLKASLESERGYHIELENPSLMPRAPSAITTGKFVVTPMEGRVRCAGIVEFGGLTAPPSRAPFRLLERQVRTAFPDLRWSGVKTWMGHRPTPVDSIPLIGPVERRPGVYVGFGHQHVGLTGGPKTGRILADLIAGRRPNFDMTPYRPERFGRVG
ncbi:MAG: NAD(P)/FAD-dependent oxidoreductase [Gammaproteobacteria bacterium]